MKRGGAGWAFAATVLAALAACGSDGDGDGGQSGGAGGAGASAAGASAGAGTGAGTGGNGGGGPRAGAGAGGTSGIGGAGGRSGAGGASGAAAGAGGSVDDDAGAAGTDGGGEPVADDPCPEGPFGDPLPAPGERTAELIQGGYDFLEGPVWVASQGALYFSDMHMGGSGWPPSTIVRFTPPNSFDDFVAESAGVGSNGLALTNDGDLLAATHDMQTLSTFDLQSAQRTTLPLTYMGDHFNSPNDLTVRADGTIYFTDPDWQLGGRTNETGMTGVYRVPPGGEPQLVDGSLDKPNGIALAPDQQTLYVSSAGADLMKYTVAGDGSTGSGSVLASPGGSDGMTVDCAGNLYITAGSVRVFSPQGAELGSISVPEQPANVAFGGTDRRTLYITARTGLYAIELNVPGYAY